MKRILCILLLLCICFAFSACTQKKSDAGFYASVNSHRIVKDQDDNDIIIINYIFRNDECAEARSFSEIVTHRAEQDDIKLSEVSSLPDDTLFSTQAQTKKLKKGESIEVEVAYKLHDNTTDVYAEVYLAIDGLFSDNYISWGEFLEIAE